MTEAEWLAATDPGPMLKHLRGKASDRKLCLFTVACFRGIDLFQHEESLRFAATTLEQFADGQADYGAMVRAAKGSESIGKGLGSKDRAVADAAWYATAMGLWYLLRPLSRTRRVVRQLRISDERLAPHLAALLREVFGPRARSMSGADRFRRNEVTDFARAVYDHRELPEGILDAARLSLLADALENAGCVDPEILKHLRGPGPHVRGCWAVDLLTNRK